MGAEGFRAWRFVLFFGLGAPEKFGKIGFRFEVLGFLGFPDSHWLCPRISVLGHVLTTTLYTKTQETLNPKP